MKAILHYALQKAWQSHRIWVQFGTHRTMRRTPMQTYNQPVIDALYSLGSEPYPSKFLTAHRNLARPEDDAHPESYLCEVGQQLRCYSVRGKNKCARRSRYAIERIVNPNAAGGLCDLL
jgi:hypothetical protein